jgi:CheY-like chemotaxis protein
MVSGIDKREACLAAGANAFLLKPYMPEELFEIIRP